MFTEVHSGIHSTACKSEVTSHQLMPRPAGCEPHKSPGSVVASAVGKLSLVEPAWNEL